MQSVLDGQLFSLFHIQYIKCIRENISTTMEFTTMAMERHIIAALKTNNNNSSSNGTNNIILIINTIFSLSTSNACRPLSMQRTSISFELRSVFSGDQVAFCVCASMFAFCNIFVCYRFSPLFQCVSGVCVCYIEVLLLLPLFHHKQQRQKTVFLPNLVNMEIPIFNISSTDMIQIQNIPCYCCYYFSLSPFE